MTDIIDDPNDRALADPIDVASVRALEFPAPAIAAAHAAVAAMPAGEPGDCTFCGLSFSRLVRGACARCRDARGMP